MKRLLSKIKLSIYAVFLCGALPALGYTCDQIAILIKTGQCAGCDFRQADFTKSIAAQAYCGNVNFDSGSYQLSPFQQTSSILSLINGRSLNLIGADLESVVAPGINFGAGSQLIAANLSGANLQGAHFEQATLSNGTAGASLYAADLTNAFFTNNQTISHVGFGGADVSGADFTGAKIQSLVGELITDAQISSQPNKYVQHGLKKGQASASGLGITYLDFRSAKNLCKAKFRTDVNHSIDIHDIVLSGITLEGCNFQDINLSRANFTGSTLHDCNFDNATLGDSASGGQGAIFDGAIIKGSSTKFWTQKAHNISFSGASIYHGVKISRTTDYTKGTDFSYGNFENAKIYGDVSNTKFYNTQASHITFGLHSNASSTDWKSSRLSYATMHGNFSESTFDGSYLNNSVISANIVGAWFNLVNLDGAYIYNSDYTNVKLSTKFNQLHIALPSDGKYTGFDVKYAASGAHSGYGIDLNRHDALRCWSNRLFALRLCQLTSSHDGASISGACKAYCGAANEKFYNIGELGCFNTTASPYEYPNDKYSSLKLTNHCAFYSQRMINKYGLAKFKFRADDVAIKDYYTPAVYSSTKPTTGMFNVTACEIDSSEHLRQNCDSAASKFGTISQRAANWLLGDSM